MEIEWCVVDGAGGMQCTVPETSDKRFIWIGSRGLSVRVIETLRLAVYYFDIWNLFSHFWMRKHFQNRTFINSSSRLRFNGCQIWGHTCRLLLTVGGYSKSEILLSFSFVLIAARFPVDDGIALTSAHYSLSYFTRFSNRSKMSKNSFSAFTDYLLK